MAESRKEPLIESILESLGIPFAFYQYKDYKTSHPPKPPYIVYRATGEQAGGADYKILLVRKDIEIELYTDKFDAGLERTIERALYPFEWEKEERFNSDEALYQTTYKFTITEKIRKDN
ncbi:MAG: hypothetical protein LUH18_03070 [Oscillospiraceae bacterium]|nr:hypothetical protein [Oscillospiraceae bacterium]